MVTALLHNRAMTSLRSHEEGKKDDQISGKGVKKISENKTCELLHVLLLKHPGTNSKQPFRYLKNIMSSFPSPLM